MQSDRSDISLDRNFLDEWEVTCLRDRGMTNSEVRKWELPLLPCEIGSVDGSSIIIHDVDEDEEDEEVPAHKHQRSAKRSRHFDLEIILRRNRLHRNGCSTTVYTCSQDDHGRPFSLLSRLEHDIQNFQPHTVPSDHVVPRTDSFDFHNEQRDLLVPPLRYSLFPKTARSSNNPDCGSSISESNDFEAFKNRLPMNAFNHPSDISQRSYRLASVNDSALIMLSHIPEQEDRMGPVEYDEQSKKRTRQKKQRRWLRWRK